MIRTVIQQDLPAICAIYNHYIASTVISFEERAVMANELAGRIGKVRQAGLPWLVAEDDGALIGYAYASIWKERSAYRFCAEISVYLAPLHTGRGWGSRLYAELFGELGKTPVRKVLGGIALPNPASIALHEKFGMQQVAHFPAVGYKFGRWIDLGYWQGELEPSP